MKAGDVLALQKNLAIQAAYKRLQNEDEIKGISLQVIFDQSLPGEQPLQIFIGADDPDYAAVKQVVDSKMSVGKAAADEQVATLSTKLSDAVAATAAATPATPATPAGPASG